MSPSLVSNPKSATLVSKLARVQNVVTKHHTRLANIRPSEREKGVITEIKEHHLATWNIINSDNDVNSNQLQIFFFPQFGKSVDDNHQRNGDN